MTESNHFHPDFEQNTIDSLKDKDIRSMPEGSARLAALRDLGATFDEGHHRTTKIATPSGTPKLPTFVDAGQIERMLKEKKQSPFSATMVTNREEFSHYGEWL
ncbi:hypothetical protein BDF21DRAFT_467019 [Thamnidium elegans]|uniref:Uncharacterized protein n=1 Tax=Thamnidium elegans TaxID=101142 RepID=A0A8H7SP43_9FUNG|nr:hypothetical protein INT48_008914 [Thamnidium elegans]KAI8063129.1 hypothetical protein BDF21DRAFT_467019 [Thamnidium elegans]